MVTGLRGTCAAMCALTIAAACSDSKPDGIKTTQAPASSSSRIADSPSVNNPDSVGFPPYPGVGIQLAPIGARRLSFHDEVLVNLRSEGEPVRFEVEASGPSYDSLMITLQIRTASDSVLFEERWGSGSYFYYVDMTAQTDSAIRHRVLRNLGDILAPGAFALKPRYCTGADWTLEYGIGVAYAEMLKERGVAHEPAAEEGANVPPAELRELVTEIEASPTFTFHSGVESIRTLAWSTTLRRLVTTCSCC